MAFGTGRRWGDWQPLAAWRAVAVFHLLIISCSALGQDVSMPTEGLYRPGHYVPLQIDATEAGLVQVRGKVIQGIDWHSSGPGSALVPLMIYSETQGELALEVNGRQVRLPRRPMNPDAPWPAGIPGIEPHPGSLRLSAIADDAYRSAPFWNGGRSGMLRSVAMGGALVVAVLYGGMLLLPWKRARQASLGVVTGGICALLAILPRPAIDRAHLWVQDGKRLDQWIMLQSRFNARAEVPWAGGVRVLVRSLDQLAKLQPTLVCGAGGIPESINVQLAGGEPAMLLRLSTAQGPADEAQAERLTSGELVRRLYGQSSTVRGGVMHLGP